jgi:WD40 repeat protein
MDTLRRQSAATSASGSSVSNEGQPSGHSTDWDEPCWPEFLFTIKEAECSLNLEVSPSTRSRRLWPRPFTRHCYHLVGLSPNCKLAFVLEEHGVHIYFLREPPNLYAELRAELSIESLQPSKGEVVDAVLSNRYFATVDRYKLDTFELDANGCLLNNHFSIVLENQANGSNWVPTCLTIFDDNRNRTWVAVGFRVKKHLGNGGDVKVYVIEASGITEEIGRYDKAFRSTIARPLESEFIRRIAFSPDGDRLACVTNNNTVLIWSWSHRGKSWRPPFEIRRDFSPVR